jgi:CRISPR-associated protein Cpf1
MGFMRGRQKVEKQVYQKFEKMLIDKLNYYVDKKKNPTEIGGSLNALQLTNKFESFQKMGKQSGFLYYVPAWNTSKMDPVTGFVNLFQIKYESIEKAQAFFGQFKAINYNSDANYFEFSFDYSQFTNKAEGTQTNWTICSYGMRIKTFRNPAKNNQWDNEEINLTEAFETLLNKYAIKYKSIDIKSGILNQTDKAFFEELIFLFKLMLQMRNSITNSTIDYLISPVANASGQFYHSDKAASNLPQNADANGAYNIARKGLWVIEQIKQTVDLRKIKLAITNKEWLAFAQKK